MKRAIVTGATGVVGMALVNKLIRENVEVLVFCNRNSIRMDAIPESRLVRIRQVDLNDYSSVQNGSKEKYDVFYHLAWAGTTGKYRSNLQMQTDNIRYAVDAVDMAARFGCNMFVGAGSQAEYGRQFEKLTPRTAVNPENGYGIAKLSAGLMTRQEAFIKNMKHVWVRILSVYGPFDGMESLINYAISELLQGKRPEFTKGEQIWDYLYSEDAAEALYRIGETGKTGHTYVLGSGEERRLADYLLELRNVVNPRVELCFGKRPYAEKQVMYLSADISDLQRDTGFVPGISFHEGIKRTMEWVKTRIEM